MSLTRARGYEAVRVTDLCAEAGVGRSTFYAHFADKDDLKRQQMAAHLRALIAEDTDKTRRQDPLAFSLPLLRHALDHRHLRRSLEGGPGEAVALEVLGEVVREHARSVLDGFASNPFGTPKEASAVFIAASWLSICNWWMRKGATVPPEEVDKIFHKLVAQPKT
jgi:AcrR family transcriptional regulator